MEKKKYLGKIVKIKNETKIAHYNGPYKDLKNFELVNNGSDFYQLLDKKLIVIDYFFDNEALQLNYLRTCENLLSGLKLNPPFMPKITDDDKKLLVNNLYVKVFAVEDCHNPYYIYINSFLSGFKNTKKTEDYILEDNFNVIVV